MRLWWLLALVGCAEAVDAPKTGPSADLGVCDDVGDTTAVLFTEIRFGRAADGVSPGFDLDAAVTEAGDSSGCGVADYTSPDGGEGIDNAFALLLPALEATEAQAVEAIIQEAINSGGILMLLELEDFDDPVDDGCVNVNLVGGLGDPLVGNHGFILAGQTFDRDAATPVSRVEGASIVDGVLVAGPLDVALPITIFDVTIDFYLAGGQLRLDLHDDGTYSGWLGGGVAIEDISRVAHEENVDPAVADLLDTILAFNADLDPDGLGACQDISVTLQYSGVSAFLFE